MKNKNWIEEQETLFWKKWQEVLIKLHWNNYRTHIEVDNENTDLWKKLRRK